MYLLCILRHIIRLFQNAKLHIIFQSSRKVTKKRVPAVVGGTLFWLSWAAETTRNKVSHIILHFE